MRKTPQQDRVVEFVRANPGCSMSDVVQAIGDLHPGTAQGIQTACSTINRTLAAGRIEDRGEGSRHRYHVVEEPIVARPARPGKLKTASQVRDEAYRLAIIAMEERENTGDPEGADCMRDLARDIKAIRIRA